MATLVWRKEAPTSYVWFIDRSGEKPVVVVLAVTACTEGAVIGRSGRSGLRRDACPP